MDLTHSGTVGISQGDIENYELKYGAIAENSLVNDYTWLESVFERPRCL